MKYVVYFCHTIKILIPKWPRRRKFSQSSQAGKPVAFDFAHHDHALVTLFVQFLCCDWSKFDSWVHGQNLCSILKTYSDFLKVRGGGWIPRAPPLDPPLILFLLKGRRQNRIWGQYSDFQKTNSDFLPEQTPIFEEDKLRFPKIKPPFSKTNSDFPKKNPLIFDKNKFRFSKKQTPIFKKTNSNFR